MNGISTEPDTWKGLQNLAESTYLSWPVSRWLYVQRGVAKQRFFQSSVPGLRGHALPQIFRNAIRFIFTIQMYYALARLRIFSCAN
jgi:hypothetical protein